MTSPLGYLDIPAPPSAPTEGIGNNQLNVDVCTAAVGGESHPWVHWPCEGSSEAKQGHPGCSLPVGRLWLVCRMGQLWIVWAELGGMGRAHETTRPQVHETRSPR